MTRFTETSCSQCGQSFGPGDHGFSRCDQHRGPVDLHIVIDRHGYVREQDGRQNFETVVTDLIAGQYEHADKVIRITPPKAGWPRAEVIEDITANVAWTIYQRCSGDRDYITYDSPAYHMIEQHVGIAHARKCLDQSAVEAAE